MMKKVLIAVMIIVSLLVVGCRAAPAPVEPVDPSINQPSGPAVTTGTGSQPPLTMIGGLVMDGSANYTVVSGDTLAEIAASRYGATNMYYFPLIRLANAGIVTDPDVIEVGTRLVIPNLQRNLDNAGSRALLRTDMLSVANQYERQGKPEATARLRNLANRL